MAVTRPSYKECVFGNVQAFGAAISAMVVEHCWFPYGPSLVDYFVGGLGAIAAAKLGWWAIRNFYHDFYNRKAWLKAQTPATGKFDGRWATQKEMADAGMYEPRGRILGTDEDGYLLFTPHKLKPSFEYVLSPQGGGKTTTRVYFSALLSALIQKRDRRAGNG